MIHTWPLTLWQRYNLFYMIDLGVLTTKLMFNEVPVYCRGMFSIILMPI